MILTEKQLMELGNRLKKKGVQKKCPLCEHDDLSIDNEIQEFLTEEGIIKEFFVMICPNCFVTFLFPAMHYGLRRDGGIYPNDNHILK